VKGLFTAYRRAARMFCFEKPVKHQQQQQQEEEIENVLKVIY
jgi:hypothetical protein